MVEADIVAQGGNMQSQRDRIMALCIEVAIELERAKNLFPEPLNSPHEAYGVIKEEFDEYWDEVKAHNPRKGRDTRLKQRAELIQLAAMALRAIDETIDNDEKYETIH
jgi:hypothetical protein